MELKEWVQSLAFLVAVLVRGFDAADTVPPPNGPRTGDDGSCGNIDNTFDDSDIVTASDDGHGSATCRDDHDDCRDRSLRGLCDTDRANMLINCPKSCLVCPEVGVQQNVGLTDHRVPMEVSIEMLRVVRETNQYYRSKILNNPISPRSGTSVNGRSPPDPNALVRRNCQDRNELCSLWRLQNRCASLDYGAYVTRECPLSCQICHTEEYRARTFLQLLSDTLPDVYYSSYETTKGKNDNHQPAPGGRSVVKDRIRTLSHFMALLGMDPQLINRPLVNDGGDPNWVEQLHDGIVAVIPPPLLRVYDRATLMDYTDDDDDDTENLLRTLFAPHDKVNLGNILVPYRHRGYVVEAMLALDHFITRPIQLAVGFAVPNEPALNQLGAEGGILQMGAGTGYWTALLRLRGVDVVAYDLSPPARADNAFFDTDYSNNTVDQGGCMEVLSNRPELAHGRTLLMIWPNDPDPVDNPDFCDNSDTNSFQTGWKPVESEAVWDTSCLTAYMQAGGERVAYVGEREEVIRRTEPHQSGKTDSGLSATRAFQQMLRNHFELVTAIELPMWWLNEDDMTIWKRQR